MTDTTNTTIDTDSAPTAKTEQDSQSDEETIDTNDAQNISEKETTSISNVEDSSSDASNSEEIPEIDKTSDASNSEEIPEIDKTSDASNSEEIPEIDKTSDASNSEEIPEIDKTNDASNSEEIPETSTEDSTHVISEDNSIDIKIIKGVVEEENNFDTSNWETFGRLDEKTGDLLQLDNSNFRGKVIRKLHEREELDAALQDAYKQFQGVEKKLRSLEQDIGQNPNPEISYDKISGFREYLATVNAFGDFDALFVRAEQLQKIVDEAHEAALNKAAELVAELTELQNLEDKKAIFDGVRKFTAQFRKINIIGEKSDSIRDNFKKVLEVLDKKIVEYKKEIEEKHFQKKAELIEVLTTHIEKNEWTQSTKEVNDIEHRWNQCETGVGPRTDELQGKFSALIEQYNQKRSEFFEQQEMERHENYLIKSKFCDIAELLSESENWKETAEELKKLQRQWKEVGPVPNEYNNALWSRFRKANDTFFERRNAHYATLEEELYKNLEIKEKYCEEVEALKDSEEWTSTSDKLIAIQKQWKEVGPVPHKKHVEIWDRFRAANDYFFNRRNAFFQEKNKTVRENFTKKRALVSEVESLLGSEDFRHAETRVRQIQKEWKRIGFAGKEKSDVIWKKFREVLDSFYDKRNQLNDSIREEHLQKKQEICTIAEEIMDSDDWKGTEDRFKQLQQEWKAIGSVPEEKSEEVWLRFKAASDNFFEKRNEEFEQNEDIWQENFKQKEELCAKAEELADCKNFRNGEKSLEMIQLDWKKIGHIPHEPSEELWKRFRKATDIFYKKRNAFFKESAQIRQENLEKKEALCESVENLNPEDEWMTGTEKIKNLQEEWKNIGHVNNSKSKSIWKRFRKGIDKFYAGRNTYFKQNLVLRQALCAEIESLDISENIEAAKKRVVEIQAEWKKSGPVARYELEKINDRFKTACDRVYKIHRLGRNAGQDDWKVRLLDTFLKKK